jgi:amino acid adenylation domain-containing protein
MTSPRVGAPAEVTLAPVDFDPFADASPPKAFPLSDAQREIWSVVQMGPEASCAYNLCFALRLVGAVAPDALRSAVGHLFARHDALRLVFDPSGEWQTAKPPGPVEVPSLDLAGQSSAEQGANLEGVLREEVETPFDLVSGPPARVRLVIEAADRCVLVLTVHHVVCDGGSIWVLFQDLAALYEAARRGETASLPPAERFVQLVDREMSPEGRESAAAAQAYWEAQFAQVPSPLDLPLDEPRPAIKSYRSAQESHGLEEALAAAVKRFAAERDVTIVGFLLAAFQVLLYRLSGQTDLVVGLTASVRDLNDLPEVVGHATNLLPFRGRVDPNGSFTAHLRTARASLLAAHDHRALTFGTLVRRISLPRDLSRTPLVDVTFNLTRGGVPWSFGNLQARLHLPPRRHMNFELELNVLDTGRGFELECAYNADLFTASTIKRWLEHYRVLLASIVRDAEVPVDRLSLLTEGQRAERRDWNATDVDFRDACVHELISREAGRRPDRTAVEFQGARLTYGELERRSTALAGHLTGLGVKPGVRVGLFMERSPDMIVGLLGILKAGGAYVPLDPAFPKERLAYMVEDSGAAAILTDAASPEEVPSRSLPLVRVDTLTTTSSAGASLHSSPVRPQHLAYVIYTSGSTGRPKGVAVTHRSLVNLLESMGREPGLTEDDVLLSVTTLSFDIAELELYLPLLKGARVALASREEALDGRSLIERLQSSGATVMQATPATWRLLLESGWEGTQALRVLCGGEALPRDLAEALLARAREVWNVYGPTETTVWSSVSRVDHGRGSVPIGRPISNTQMWILDRHLEPMPTGVPGELYIGGAGLAQGYWDRPDLTAERFVVDPFSKAPGARFYRTGDLARWRADGTIDCLGRIDHQVKVRGYRIELGEIEESLRQHPGIEAAVVLAQDAAGGDRRLVAYLAHGSSGQPNVTALRTHLKASLPTYMIPSSFVFLDRLPLTPNGKLDRKALAELESGHTSGVKAHVAPRTPAETFIAQLWQEALGIERVGVRDNFFDLGGHSLLAMRVLTGIEKKTGHRFHPRDIIFQTLEQLAAACPMEASPAPVESAAQGGLGGRVVRALQALVRGKGTPTPDA